MSDPGKPFWETTPLAEMSSAEWEALCDGCAKCCLLKLEDEDTGDIAFTRVHCRLLDAGTCRCSDYKDRKASVPDCVILTPKSVAELKWMPRSCAYRLIHEGKPLPNWHHLISHDPTLVHKDGHSIIGQTVSEDTVFEEDQMDWIVDWDGNTP
ncbi:MAG: YcgN family cysteine cluster protein [Henriciella sp.]|nr:YcgN family cysteine cluster protein [Henriciella sp.]